MGSNGGMASQPARGPRRWSGGHRVGRTGGRLAPRRPDRRRLPLLPRDRVPHPPLPPYLPVAGLVPLVAEADGRVVGFVAGSGDVGGLYRSFLWHDGAAAALSVAGRLLRRWRRALETLRHGSADGGRKGGASSCWPWPSNPAIRGPASAGPWWRLPRPGVGRGPDRAAYVVVAATTPTPSGSTAGPASPSSASSNCTAVPRRCSCSGTAGARGGDRGPRLNLTALAAISFAVALVGDAAGHRGGPPDRHRGPARCAQAPDRARPLPRRGRPSSPDPGRRCWPAAPRWSSRWPPPSSSAWPTTGSTCRRWLGWPARWRSGWPWSPPARCGSPAGCASPPWWWSPSC